MDSIVTKRLWCSLVNTYRFWWDELNIEHIANHGVEPYEAEAAVTHARLIRKVGKGKYIAYGQTDSGRYLSVVFAPKDQRRTRIVSARDMTPAEKRNLRK
jgi:uncharacterized DUF497 family protein